MGDFPKSGHMVKSVGEKKKALAACASETGVTFNKQHQKAKEILLEKL